MSQPTVTTQRTRTILGECICDLGITVLYAGLVGFAIVAIVASDNGPPSLLAAFFYVAVLPGLVVAMIALDATARLWAERRDRRRVSASAFTQTSGYGRAG